MFGLGFTEIIALLVLALLVIGPKQLPELARNLGRFFNELKRTTNMFKDEFKSTLSEQVRPPTYRPPPDVEPQPEVTTETTPAKETSVFKNTPHEPGPDFYYGEPPSYEKGEIAGAVPEIEKKESGTDDKP